ncbi:ladderlectin-like isoform X1 [Nerophis lumbriciformis]|uniref:ladderlectin-like isoform X1 n=1 Tax=Nerophis lumbriciformis TaxID=546530 RepID=UPI002ADF3986|nr:ladderlectin-like isoform X1 [Nerophis lumbriciformis]
MQQCLSAIAQMAFSLGVFFLLCGISGLMSSPQRSSSGKSGYCPKDWTQLNDRCYIYLDYPSTFAAAERTCKILHANLVSIRSRTENAVVLQLIRNANDGDLIDTWTGLHDTIEEDDFIWTDGTEFDFEDFADGEPNSLGGNEDCVDIEGDDGQWHDNECSDESPFICTRDVIVKSDH